MDEAQKSLCPKELRKTDKRNKHPSREVLTHLPVISDVASMNECTGLMPTLAETPEEWEAYRRLFSMELPETEVWHRSTAQKAGKSSRMHKPE